MSAGGGQHYASEEETDAHDRAVGVGVVAVAAVLIALNVSTPIPLGPDLAASQAGSSDGVWLLAGVAGLALYKGWI